MNDSEREETQEEYEERKAEHEREEELHSRTKFLEYMRDDPYEPFVVGLLTLIATLEVATKPWDPRNNPCDACTHPAGVHTSQGCSWNCPCMKWPPGGFQREHYGPPSGVPATWPKCRQCGHGMNNHHSRAMTDVYECWECGLPSQLGKIGQCDQP